MRLRFLIVAVFIAALIVGCHPMQNKDLANHSRDDTNKQLKKAGGADDE